MKLANLRFGLLPLVFMVGLFEFVAVRAQYASKGRRPSSSAQVSKSVESKRRESMPGTSKLSEDALRKLRREGFREATAFPDLVSAVFGEVVSRGKGLLKKTELTKSDLTAIETLKKSLDTGKKMKPGLPPTLQGSVAQQVEAMKGSKVLKFTDKDRTQVREWKDLGRWERARVWGRSLGKGMGSALNNTMKVKSVHLNKKGTSQNKRKKEPN